MGARRALGTDFIVFELAAIVERLASDFDRLPEIVEGVSAGRMFVTADVLVRAAVDYGLELTDRAVELIGIELDR